MRKINVVMMTLILITMFTTSVFADGNTILTAVIPEATYEMVIPANQTIPYGSAMTVIGPVRIINSQGFINGKYVKAQVSYTPLKSTEGGQIPYVLRSVKNDSSTSAPMDNQTIIFENDGNGGVKEFGYVPDPTDVNFRYNVDNLAVYIFDEYWVESNPGVYSSTITFTSQVVTP